MSKLEPQDGLPEDAPRFADDEYVVHARLGQGGAAVLWRGYNPSGQRTVAIKVLHHNLSNDAQVQKGFRDEFKILCALNERVIPAAIAQKPCRDGRMCLIMQFINGESLRSRLRDRLPIARALKFASDIASALKCVHEQKVIHLDVKPENILIDHERDVAVLVDFGNSWVLHTNYDTVTRLAAKDEEKVKQMRASYIYLSPEQYNQKVPTTASDMFAFGCVLYELLTGRVAFSLGGKTDYAWDASPSMVFPAGVASTVIELIKKCLVIDHEKRTITAAEAVATLLKAADEARAADQARESAEQRRIVDPVFLKSSARRVLRRVNGDRKGEYKLVKADMSATGADETIHLVDFRSAYDGPIISGTTDRRIKQSNASFPVRMYLPQLTESTARFDRCVLMLNGLAESSSSIFDGLGMQFASDNVPALLLPLPRHLSRFAHTKELFDPFRPGKDPSASNGLTPRLDKDYERLCSQQLLQSVLLHPETLPNAFKQLASDVNGLLGRLKDDQDIDFGGLFHKDTRFALLGYSIGGLYSLSIMVEKLLNAMDDHGVPPTEMEDTSKEKRQQILDELPFSSVFLLESGLPIDQIDSSRLYYRPSETARLLADAYLTGEDAKANRSFIDGKVEHLFSDREKRKKEEFDTLVKRLDSGESMPPDAIALFERSRTDAKREWNGIMHKLHLLLGGLDPGDRNKQAFRHVFLGENPIQYRSLLEVLSRRLLIVTGGADEIFPAQKLLSGSLGDLATLQVPGISHWLKAGTSDHWKHWEKLVVELMKEFESTAAGVGGDDQRR